MLTLELDLVGEADVVALDEGVLGVDVGVALTDARWTTDGGEGEVVVEDVVRLDGLGVDMTGIGRVGEGVDTVPEDDVLEVDEDGATNRTGGLDREVEVVELLPDEVIGGLEVEVLEVDGGTENDVDEDVLLVRLEVLVVVGMMELELVDRLGLLDEVVGVGGTLEELDEEEMLQPGVVKYEVEQSVFAALRKKTSLLKMVSGQETVLVTQGPKLIEEDIVGLGVVVITILTGGLEVELVVGMELLLLVVLIEVNGGEEEELLLLVEDTEVLLVEEIDDDCEVEVKELLLVEEEEKLPLVEDTEVLVEELDDDFEVEDEELDEEVLEIEELELDVELIIGMIEEEENEDDVDEVEELDEVEDTLGELDELDELDEVEERLDKLEELDEDELEELVLVLETVVELVLVLEILEEVELELLLRDDVVGDEVVVTEQDVGTAVVVQLVVSCLLFFPPGTCV
jgi:hypothetical protein